MEPELNPNEQRVLDAIDDRGLLALLDELIAIPSLSGQETAAQEHVAAWMKSNGLAVDVWELDFDTLRRHPAYSAEVEREEGLGVVGTMGEGQGGRSLILNGHVDVVPAGDESAWQYPPWQGTSDGGLVYGRGALDMKGGLCCALFAAKAIADTGVKLKGKLHVESVVGEEDGGVGTLAAILRGYRADGAVAMEPTKMAVVPTQAGALNFRLTVPGLAAHACVRDEGVSAIEKFFPVYQALTALEKERNHRVEDPLLSRYALPYPLSMGTIRAGSWASSVPENLTVEGRYGVAIGEDINDARTALEQTVARAAANDPWLRDHPPIVEWWGGQYEPARIDVSHPIVTTVSGAFGDVTEEAPNIDGVTFGSDMRLLINEGDTPAVLFGPGDVRNSHKADENVPIGDLEIVVRTLALTALRFCGHEQS